MWRRGGRRPRGGLFFAASVVLLIVACSEPVDPTFSGSRGVEPTQASPPSVRDGLWAGTTAEGLLVQFTIAGGTISDLTITIDLAGECGVDAFKANVRSAANAVQDQSIVVGDSANAVSLRGQFADDATASGVATLNYVGKFADGTPCRSFGTTTWTASRNW